MQNARAYKMVEKTPFAFAAEQLLLMHPLILPFWLAGLVHYFATPEGRRHQLLAWIWIATFALLATSGSARSNYLGPAYTVLLPAGGVAFERLARRRRWRWLPATAATLFVAGGAIGVPLALPLLPPDRYPSYERALGIRAPVEQVDELGAMPLHFALRFGWPELRAALHQALATLAPPERAEAVVLGRWFGDTAVINAYREREGFPPAISGHNNYWIWGPGEARGEIVLAVAEDDAQLRTWFADVRRVAEVDCALCMPNVDRLAIYACRKPLRPIREWWPEAKRFI